MSHYVHESSGQPSRNWVYNANGGGEQYQPMPQPPPIPAFKTDSYPFFLLGEGISRQVIQTDLPRYLGNNSQCKPGHDANVWPCPSLLLLPFLESVS